MNSAINVRPIEGITTDAAHSMKHHLTQYRGVDLKTGVVLFSKKIGNQTVNIGEFLAVISGIKYIIENNFYPQVIYTDSITAITWFNNKQAASKKKYNGLFQAEVFLKAYTSKIESIQVVHWNNNLWGEIPAGFGFK